MSTSRPVFAPLVLFMVQQHPASRAAFKSNIRLKFVVGVLIVLLILQYLFGYSIYELTVVNYNKYVYWSRAPPWMSANDTTPEANATPADAAKNIVGDSAKWFKRTENSNNVTSLLSKIVANNKTKVELKNYLTSALPTTVQQQALESCPLVPPILVGPIKVWFDYPTFEKLEELYPFLEPGGHGKPETCLSRHRVAIILPYRDRERHLRAFLHNLHSLLTKQQLDYAIYVVEEIPNQTFNRAKLMNIGYAEAQKQYDWQCVIFHDVDLYPEDDRNLYTCPDQPRHMSVAIDKFNYKLPYSDIFGGISALTKEQFEKINGFSNDYWGWGGEDDDMASRVKMHDFQISRYPANIARYKMVKHSQEKENPVNKCRYNLMYKVKQRWKKDGLSTLKYKVVKLEKRKLYTWILVDLLEAESKQMLVDQKLCTGE